MADTATAQVTLRLPQDVKRAGYQFFEACGLSFNQGMVLLLNQALAKGEIVIRPRYNKETLAALQEVAELKKHPDTAKGYTDVEQMMEELLA